MVRDRVYYLISLGSSSVQEFGDSAQKNLVYVRMSLVLLQFTAPARVQCKLRRPEVATGILYSGYSYKYVDSNSRTLYI